MMELPDEVKKYLGKQDSGKWKTVKSSAESIDTVIVIPAIEEYENIRTLIVSLLNNETTYFKNTLVLFVINSIEGSSQEVLTDNQKSLSLLIKIVNEVEEKDELINSAIHSDLSFSYIDMTSHGKQMPEKHGGVGMARKIGMDLSLEVFDYSLQQQKIIISLDADCTVDRNYLNAIREKFNNDNANAAVVYFEHDLNSAGENLHAITCYEIFLRYYVLGLKYAKSPFAFHTVGSTIVCDYQSYIKSGGMKRRKAGEDFYFLEKLAKIGEISNINETTVYPSSRKSLRVPFGTGKRIERFMKQVQDEYMVYSVNSFDVLKKWLLLFHNPTRRSGIDCLNAAKEIEPELYNFLVAENFADDWEKILSNSKNKMQLQKQKINWFDGFKTLKLIHHLRDTIYPNINMFNALDILFDKINCPEKPKRNNEDIPDIEIQKQYVDILRNIHKQQMPT